MVFLYKLAPGAAGASFGLNVALMAGLPPSVVARASMLASSGLSQAPPAQVSSGGDSASGEVPDASCRDTKAASHGRAQTVKNQTGLVSALREVLAAPIDQNSDSLVALQGRVKQALDEV